jgi:hypothetical protein
VIGLLPLGGVRGVTVALRAYAAGAYTHDDSDTSARAESPGRTMQRVPTWPWPVGGAARGRSRRKT